MIPQEKFLNTVLAPVEWGVRAITPPGPWFLTYHGIGEDDHNISLPIDTFREHVEWVAESEFEAMSLTEFFDRGEPSNAVVFTFDDGTQGQFDDAARILSEHETSAVFFLTTSFLGDDGYMSWADADRLADDHEIGSHTVTHSDLAGIEDDATLHEELIESRSTLCERTGADVPFLAVPYGKANNVSERVMPVIEESGYRGICTTTGVFPGRYEMLPWGYRMIERTPINVYSTEMFRSVLRRRTLARLALRTWQPVLGRIPF